MNKKIIKYTSRTILGLFALFWGLATWCALTPMEGYHHCEAGQEDWSPMTCALITVASLIVFCVVWYLTREKQSPNTMDKIPEPYNSYADFEKYLSELNWIEIKDRDELVDKSGLYLFNCRGDNHTFLETHELKKGEKLCKHYLDHHPDGWAIVKPFVYHYVEDGKNEFVKEWANKM